MTQPGWSTSRSHVCQKVRSPNHRGQPAAGADPDSITLANGDLEFRWSCDATNVGNT